MKKSLDRRGFLARVGGAAGAGLAAVTIARAETPKPQPATNLERRSPPDVKRPVKEQEGNSRGIVYNVGWEQYLACRTADMAKRRR